MSGGDYGHDVRLVIGEYGHDQQLFIDDIQVPHTAIEVDLKAEIRTVKISCHPSSVSYDGREAAVCPLDDGPALACTGHKTRDEAWTIDGRRLLPIAVDIGGVSVADVTHDRRMSEVKLDVVTFRIYAPRFEVRMKEST